MLADHARSGETLDHLIGEEGADGPRNSDNHRFGAKLLAEHRAQIDGARAEAQKLIVEGRQIGEKIRADMIEETRVQQQDMIGRARSEIESEKANAIAEMRRVAVDLAIAGAGKVIEKNLDDASNRSIVESFLSSIPVQQTAR